MNDDIHPHRSESRAEPRGGSIIADRYQVDKLIARGGMSTVYLAHQTKLGRPVALKVLSPPPSGDEAASFEQRFKREAQTLAQLEHPNIVVLYDYGETEDGRYYLAMEYIDGPRMSDVLKAGPLPVQRALNLVIQICMGLRFAHKRGVVHRDLKPSNLLIRRNDDGQELVKIVDFGLVKLTDVDQAITRTGLILGSPHCMAPEQVKGVEIDHRADIYAVGVLLFRMLTGQYPFHGTNSAATMIAHLNHPIPTFFSVAPELEVPPGLEEIVRKCLAKHPSERYGSMRELIEALTALMDTPPEGMRTMTQTHTFLPVEARSTGAGTQAAIAVALFGGAALIALSLLFVGVIAIGGILQSQWSEAARESTLAPIEPAGTAAAPPAAQPAPAAPPEAPVTAAQLPAEAPPPPLAPPEPVPAPAPAAAKKPPKPRPPPTPAPVVAPAETPAPAPATPAAQAKDEAVPEGYLGLPDDLE